MVANKQKENRENIAYIHGEQPDRDVEEMLSEKKCARKK